MGHFAMTTERRSAAAALATTGVAGISVYEGLLGHGSPFAFAAAGLLGAAAFGFTRRSLPVQIASRGSVFLVAASMLLGTVGALDVASIGALIAALWLARPMLDTEEAQRAFAPARYRNVFLAGATSMTTAAIGAAAYAGVGVAFGSPITIAFNATLAVVFLVAVRALLKMRTWGLLLGAVASVALLALAPFYGSTNAITLSLAAAPALLLWVVPLLFARKNVEAPVRIATAVPVATDTTYDEENENEERDEAAPALRCGSRAGS